jgi:hypothetical protein
VSRDAPRAPVRPERGRGIVSPARNWQG